jgi:hypothetical protein
MEYEGEWQLAHYLRFVDGDAIDVDLVDYH